MRHYRYSLETTTPAAAEPLVTADVKTHLRVDHTSDDDLINDLIASVREVCERVTGLSLINRSYSLYMDSWDHDTLFLPKPPVVSISAINIYAADDTSTEFSSSNYLLDNKHPTEARLILKKNAITPLPGKEANGIEVQYTAGFGAAASNVPELLKQGMMQLLAHLYEHRGDDMGRALKLSGADAIFKTYHKARLG